MKKMVKLIKKVRMVSLRIENRITLFNESLSSSYSVFSIIEDTAE